jgi:uncharacterized protein
MKIRLNSLTEGYQTINQILPKEKLDLQDSWFISPINVSLLINKGLSEITIKCNLQVEAQFTCDRCLSPFKQILKSSCSIILSYTDLGSINYDETIVPITSLTSEVDITQQIRDSLITSVPMKKLCKEDCLGLCPHCGVNLNFEKCKCDKNSIDARWEPLKNLQHN